MSLALTLAPALLAACGGEPAEAPLRSAVLVTLDTTNPPALDVYGPARDLTPALAAFAEDAVVFDRAWTVAPLTLPSHASMMTGLYPPRHTVRDNGHLPLPRSAETVAERAREAGYQTAAFVAAAVLGPQYGIDQGFATFDAPGGKSGQAGKVLERTGREITADAVTWLDARDVTRPFFLWVHYFDPHAPYQASAEFLARAKGRPYLGEIAALDATVGDLLARLASEPTAGELLVVVVADHGESLGRHGEATHGLLAYDATLRVPLLVRPPGGRGGRPARDARTASVVDVAPTLFAGMGLPAPPGLDGLDLLRPAADVSRGVYFESYTGFLNYGWSPLTGWVEEGDKYLHGVAPELYDLGVDPDEANDVYRPDDSRVARARRGIAGVGDAPALERGADEATLVAGAEDLGALGYGASASAEVAIPHPLEPPDLPSPRSRLDEFARVDAAMTAGNVGRRAEAIEALAEVVANNPRHSLAARTLAMFLVAEGRPRDALPPLEGLIASGLDGPIVRQRAAEALALMGEFDRALEHLVEAERMRPGDPGTRELRERLERLRGGPRED